MPEIKYDSTRLELVASQIIEARGGDVRNALKALIVEKECLETELKDIRARVSTGFTRGAYRRLPASSSA
jgi:hypothetical protein